MEQEPILQGAIPALHGGCIGLREHPQHKAATREGNPVVVAVIPRRHELLIKLRGGNVGMWVNCGWQQISGSKYHIRRAYTNRLGGRGVGNGE